MNWIKRKMLTSLFSEWVQESKDLDTLQLSKELIHKRIVEVDNVTQVIGFKQY
jgi:hypothetical protein|tara:strand:+ start:379 stop:537 length:159 start_codon:yes stop_codon:yes gene_type:complete